MKNQYDGRNGNGYQPIVDYRKLQDDCGNGLEENQRDRLTMAQYVADNIIGDRKRVVSTRCSDKYFEWVLVYDDGSEGILTGKLAAELRKAGK